MLNRKGIVVIILTLLFILIIIYKNWYDTNSPYETKYIQKLGFESYYYTEKILQTLGEPIDIKKEVDTSDGDQFFYMLMTFNGYKLLFNYPEEGMPQNRNDYKLSCAWITSSNYKIGKYNIGIGSDKSLVEKAYRKKKRLEDGRFGFIDGIIWVEFVLDTNEKVKEIIFTTGGP